MQVGHDGHCRELTEPEFDRDYSSLGRDQERSRSRASEGDQLENISSQQLQEELNRIIANYKEKKNKKNSEKASDEKFIISV